ncbi:D-glycero-D-manno-heptose 1,7-bisphosphate phosphatase [Angulomicrobium tetraedrale]|uniref:D,D-heptose 1,7-bisphosphate phosphatase n=1 Tax=Ancylobacter tetraedralis TaxID=217068 RepID=A0A839ZGM3_9HYPH|nr:HAD-IIIA family hydrolase [Ancylobacter tetraedralis]MBB3773712.1 D-glycero-D-manno-heptose 1,7-bisphosphate phosphatase [Ancylobacter tetraedralis]
MLSQALILCGGLGTRLGELTAATPKPMLPVAGRPFLDHLIQQTARYGITRIVLLAGRFGEQIVAAYHGRTLYGASIEVVVEPAPLGTGGALRFAADRLEPEFLLLNGDSWIDADLTGFARAWRTARADDPTLAAQMLLQVVPDVARFGSVTLEGNRVVAFLEKNAARAGTAGLINAGVYLLTRDIVDLVPEGVACSLETDALPLLVAQRRVAAVTAPEGSYFIDIGVPETFARVQTELPRVRMRPALFLDRDGTLNRDAGYTHRVEDLDWMPDAREAIAHANAAGYYVFVVTNQAGVARGLYDEAAIASFHAAMQEQLGAIGGHIDAIEWCPHHVDGTVDAYRRDCDRRKPGPGMINDLLAAWPVERARSVLIGDSDTDMAAADAAGLRAIRYRGGSLLDLLKTSI